GKVYLGGEGEAIGAYSDNPDLAWEYRTETYLNADGELKARDLVGSTPARNDASQEKATETAELLEPFASSLNELGARYPAANLSPDSVADVQSTMGEAWSAVLAGQQSPEDAAAQVVNTLKSMTG